MQPVSQTTIMPEIAALVSEFGASIKLMGLDLLPILPVEDDKGQYKYLAGDQVKREPASYLRGPNGEYYDKETNFTEGDYSTKEYGLIEAIDDGNKAKTSKFFDIASQVSKGLMFNLMQAQEGRIKALLESTALFTSGYQQAVTTKWNTNTTATPVNDIAKAKNKLMVNSGVSQPMGQKLVLGMSYALYEYLLNTTEIKQCLGYGNKEVALGRATEAQVAGILGVDSISLSYARSGASDLWDKQYAYLVYASDSKDWSVPRLGNSFLWSKDSSSNAVVETYRDEARRSDIIRVRHYVGEEVININNGILLTGCYA